MDVIALWPPIGGGRNELIVYDFNFTDYSCSGYTVVNRDGEGHTEKITFNNSKRRAKISKNYKIERILHT